MIPVYEEKQKGDKLVRKVRLVADGRQHRIHGETYSATPSREELLILLHIIACKGWEYFHLDEVRAFLNADRKDKDKIYCKFRGDPLFYEIIKAVYGLKTASHDHQATVIKKLVEQMGFTRLSMCNCIFIKEDEQGRKLIVYVYVADFLLTGTDLCAMSKLITDFWKLSKRTIGFITSWSEDRPAVNSCSNNRSNNRTD